MPPLGITELDNGLVLAFLTWKSLPVLSASKNFPISTWSFPALGEVGYFMKVSSGLSFLVAKKLI